MPPIIQAATTYDAADTLDVLLSEGVDPNLRPDVDLDALPNEIFAHPHIRDGCGNTVPRYLADCSNINSDGLTESGLYSGLNIELRHDDRRSSAPRELLYMFLKRGVDVRARNNERLTAVRILLDTGRTWLEKTRMVLRQSVA
ncbi:hypothetical protein MPDQ_000936 [Monascus purpureus]|uniref:Uncharacterized protein n=1 Tax=Monascus purpureus TaxID=5098 RepID=A0A507QNQ1_MONPU|nr:hypothetical protein MPDQ_000936 [Monascus purpureus]